MSYNIKTQNDLSVDGITVEEVFRRYVQDYYLVNRRYQRKLVWTLDQRKRLIDSIMMGLPIPLVLLADTIDRETHTKRAEVIDGLQRLHAIISYIRNEYSWNGEYFNLKAMASTLDLLDSGELKQQEPVQDRDVSVAFTQYKIPMSSFSGSDTEQIDEVFRRINSSGRQLSRQEVRQAGTTGLLTDAVRKISAQIRGDNTMSDILTLANVPTISLKFPKDSIKGMPVEEIFWVREGLLRRDDLRSSKDEEIVLDLLFDIFSIKETLNADNRANAYDFNTKVGRSLDEQLRVSGLEHVIAEFQNVIANIENLSDYARRAGGYNRLIDLLGLTSGNPQGRYFHVLFMAIYRHLDRGRRIGRIDEMVSSLDRYWEKRESLSGASWTYEGRKKQIHEMYKHISDGFVDSNDPGEAALRDRTRELIRKLHSYPAETEWFELKAGLLQYRDEVENNISDQNLKKVKLNVRLAQHLGKVAVAMANAKPRSNPFIYLGVAEKSDTGEGFAKDFGINAIDINTTGVDIPYEVVGIDHELRNLNLDYDGYISMITNGLYHNQSLSNKTFKKNLIDGVSFIKVVGNNGESRNVVEIKIPAVDELVPYGGEYWVKVGSHMKQLKNEEILTYHKAHFVN